MYIKFKNSKFKKLMLNTILQWDFEWLDKNEDGSWKVKETRRGKNTRDDFPQTDNYTHDVLSKMNELLNMLNDKVGNRDGSPNLARITYGDEAVKIAQSGDIRLLYFFSMR